MKCWINKKAFTAVIDEGARMFPLETGGLLAGYWAGDEVVITDVIGPGPGATHDRFSFDADYDWQRKEMSDLWHGKEGKIAYLGDWHTHPCGPTLPSALDMKTLRSIADNEAAMASKPLMLIVGKTLDVFSVYCFKQGSLISLEVQSY